jgi:tetratricopeptide (TPR) repeat protein
MKRTISLWLGLLAFALLPALAQTPAANTAPSAPKGPTGKIHGRVTGPEGAPRTSGTVSLSNDGGRTSKYTFPLSSTGDYAGEASPGAYTLVFRQPDTPLDKMNDSIDNVKIMAGQDLLQDDDMSRKEFIDKNLSAEQKKQLEELRKHNSEAMKTNEVIKSINDDLKAASQDLNDADGAHAAALQVLGANATKAEIEAKEAEIRTAKFTEVETLMLKDTAVKPDASVLWVQLAQAQIGLKKYEDAETTYKKVLELEAASKKPNPQVQGAADAGLGEIYARTGKVPEASAAYDAAAKANPASAGVYLKNEAVIFYQMNNGEAQVAAADKAIQVDPGQPILYYLKGQGLIAKAEVDAKTGRYILPSGCAEAYQKYLELAPTGQFANDVRGILEQAGEKLVTSYTAGKPKK